MVGRLWIYLRALAEAEPEMEPDLLAPPETLPPALLYVLDPDACALADPPTVRDADPDACIWPLAPPDPLTLMLPEDDLLPEPLTRMLPEADVLPEPEACTLPPTDRDPFTCKLSVVLDPEAPIDREVIDPEVLPEAPADLEPDMLTEPFMVFDPEMLLEPPVDLETLPDTRIEP